MPYVNKPRPYKKEYQQDLLAGRSAPQLGYILYLDGG